MVVGYGDGALAFLDSDGKKAREIPLDGHPESFQIEKTGTRVFVNVPDHKEIQVADLVKKISNSQKPGSQELYTPHIKFNRRIGVHAHQRYTVDGQAIDDPEKYETYLKTVLPQPEHYQMVHGIEKEPGWIESKKADSLLK